MPESVTITLDADLVRNLDDLKSTEDATYGDVISTLLHYISDDDDYITEEERQEIYDILREVESGVYCTSEEVDEILRTKSE